MHALLRGCLRAIQGTKRNTYAGLPGLQPPNTMLFQAALLTIAVAAPAVKAATVSSQLAYPEHLQTNAPAAHGSVVLSRVIIALLAALV